MTVRTSFSATQISAIQGCVADFYGVALKEMLGAHRAKCVARPRMMAMFLCKELTLYSLPLIGRAFNRDHTTVLHAVRTIRAMLAQYPQLETERGELLNRLLNSQGTEIVNTGALYLRVSLPKSGGLNVG